MMSRAKRPPGDVVLGVDLGGSGVRAWAAPLAGPLPEGVLARGTAGPANPVRSGPEACKRELARAIRSCLAGLELSPGSVGACCVGMAGRSHPDAERLVQMALPPVLEPATVEVVSDIAIAHEAAFAGGEGLLLLAGTGSGALARGPLGVRHAGGAGPDQGDPGSAARIAQQARTRGLRRGPVGDLRAELEALERRARGGDALVRRLYAEQAQLLALDGDRAARAAGLPGGGSPVATAGGMLASGRWLRGTLEIALAARHASLGAHVGDPVLGALSRARRLLAR